MSEPPIVSSGQPHTVSLPEGSSVAAQRRPQRVGARLADEAPDRVPAAPSLAASGLASAMPRGTVQAADAAGRGLSGAGAAGAQVATPSLNAALIERIAALERQNDQVRAALDRAEPAQADSKRAGAAPVRAIRTRLSE